LGENINIDIDVAINALADSPVLMCEHHTLKTNKMSQATLIELNMMLSEGDFIKI